MTDVIKGYKAFNKNMTNRYGTTFESGKTYTIKGPLAFGNSGNGFHFCKRLEDTLRYFPAMEEEIKIAKVTSTDEVVESWDNFYEYYDMYAARTLTIDKILTREEIIQKMLTKNSLSVKRFVSLFGLTQEEIALFKSSFLNNVEIQRAIAYYQEKDEEAYSFKRGIDYYKVKIKSINETSSN